MWANGGTLSKEALTLRKRLSILGKVLVGFLCIIRPKERPIFIFSTRRSGSTLLMRLIHSQPGVDYIDEPLNLWRLHPHPHRLPHPPFGYFLTLSNAQGEKLYRYFQDLLRGKARFRHRGNLLDPGRTFIVRRLVIKNINATPLIDWFAEKFDADIVYLVRHPGAIAESIMRKGWKSAAQAYLSSEVYLERHLNSEQIRLARSVLARGSPFQQGVLEWCLDNLYPLSVWRERPWLTLSYEELVLRPRKVVGLLCERLRLPEPERMLKVFRLPSRTASVDSKRLVQVEGPERLVTRWRERVDKAELERMDEVLTAFGVEVYNAYSPYPAESLCHFGPLEGWR